MQVIAVMIAIDQSKLRLIVETILADESLSRDEGTALLQISQLAAGADETEQRVERALLQAIAQRISSLNGDEPAELIAIPPIQGFRARMARFRTLAATLQTRPARELGFALAFLVAISDLELQRSEQETLEELQHALGVGHRRATDLVVQLTDIIAESRRTAVSPA